MGKRILKKLGAIVLVVAVLAGLMVARVSFVSWLRGEPETVSASYISDEILRAGIQELARSYPIMIDSNTEAAGVMLAGRQIVYRYRLIKVASDEIDGPAFIAAARPEVTNSQCTLPETRWLLEGGVSMRLDYAANDGRHLGTVLVSLEDCG